MKIKDVLLTCIFMLSSFSCAMEDDSLLNDMHKEQAGTDNGKSVMAALAVSVFVDELSTKAVPTEEEKTEGIEETELITDCSIILLNADNTVLNVREKVGINELGQVDATFTLKQQAGLKVVVIANTSQSFVSCPSMTEICEQVQNATDLGAFVKMGIQDEISVENATFQNPTNVLITLHQLTARIELADFVITPASFGKTLPAEVKLTKISLLNQRLNCKTSLKGDNTMSADRALINPNPVVSDKSDIVVYAKNASDEFVNTSNLKDNTPVFYSFPSVVSEDVQYEISDKAVAMQIEFSVGGVPHTKIYKIQHAKGSPSVKSGYLYRLYVRMTAESDEMEFDVTCRVRDWQKNVISSEMEEVL